MSLRFPRYGVLLLFVAGAAVTIGCESSATTSPTAPSSAPSAQTQSLISTDPQTLRPEILPGTSCVGHPAFGTRVVVVLGGRTDMRVRGLRFRFSDRDGISVVPQVTTFTSPTTLSTSPIPTPVPTPIPTSMPIPLPTTSAVPIPGQTSGQDVLVRAGTPVLVPCLLTFACGVVSDGFLIITVDAAGASGAFGTSELRVRVGF